MSKGTVIKSNSVHVEQYQIMLAAPGTPYGEWFYFSGWEDDLNPDLLEGAEEIPRDNLVRLVATPDPETGDAIEPVFDFDTLAPQELDSRFFLQVMSHNRDRFPLPAEPEPEPRYKTHMTPAEFVRDVVTQPEWAAIGVLVSQDPVIWAWAYTTGAGEIWVEHPDFAAGLQLGIDNGIWNQARADEIAKGLLIE